MIRPCRCLMLLILLAWTLPALAVPAKTAAKPKEDDYELYKLLADTIDQVERNYVKEVDRRELIEAAIRGVLAKLDPYSTYIGPDEMQRFRAEIESEFGGIGIQIDVDDGQLTILSPIYGTPAYRAGLLAGDRIVEIDGKTTDGLTIDDAVAAAQGGRGHLRDAHRDPSGQGSEGEGHAEARADSRRHRAGRPPQAGRPVGLHARSEAPHRLRAADGLQPRHRRATAAGA